MLRPSDSELIDLLIALADAVNFHIDHNDPDADLEFRARAAAQSLLNHQQKT